MTIIPVDVDRLKVHAGPDVVKMEVSVGRTGQRGSRWFSGPGMPSELTIPDYGQLVTNDLYFDTETGVVYQYIMLPSNTRDWVEVYTLDAGPKGDKGDPGDPGDTGPEGPSGQAGTYVGVKTVTGTTYTVEAGDVGWLIRYTSADAVTVTLPAAVGSPGQTIDHAQRGAGSLTFVAGAGAAPLIVADTAVTRKLGSMATTIKEAANTWSAVGDLA